MILLFAWTSSPEYSAGLHRELWQVHVHLSVFGLAWKALNREKCYLYPLELGKELADISSGAFSQNPDKLFSELKLVTDNLSLYSCSSQLRSHWKIWKDFSTTVEICQWLQNLSTSSLHLCLFCSLACSMEIWECEIDYIYCIIPSKRPYPCKHPPSTFDSFVFFQGSTCNHQPC